MINEQKLEQNRFSLTLTSLYSNLMTTVPRVSQWNIHKRYQNSFTNRNSTDIIHLHSQHQYLQSNQSIDCNERKIGIHHKIEDIVRRKMNIMNVYLAAVYAKI